MAPWEMENVVEKLWKAGAKNVWQTERGTTFGYNNLVVDYRGIPEMQKTGCPVIFDGTHSVQQPAAKGTTSGGTREHVPTLVRAAVAAGADGLFLEVHPNPPKAKSDAATQITFETFRQVLKDSLAIRRALKGNKFNSITEEFEGSLSYKMYSDGACRGNPGPSGIGAVILRDDKVIHEIAKFIGTTTNNVAEYGALLAGLDYCVKKKLSPLEILADSQLMIRQLSGQYKVKHPNIIPLLPKRQKNILTHLKVTGYTHVMREFNKRADELANEGIDNHFSK